MRKLLVGSRTSRLAKIQAELVIDRLASLHIDSQWIGITSKGDEDRDRDLSDFAERGVFTKTLDTAVLAGEIDLAVHSLKDCPALIHEDLVIGAHLPREYYQDVLIYKNPENKFDDPDFPYSIATCSTRRRSLWKSRYPNTDFKHLRGNVPGRLAKLYNNPWDGIILSKAGISRLGMDVGNILDLEWMTPAPGQGVIGAICRKSDLVLLGSLEKMDDRQTRICATLERTCMEYLEYSCQSPIGALSKYISPNQLSLEVSICRSKGTVQHFNEIFELTHPFEASKYIHSFVSKYGIKKIT